MQEGFYSGDKRNMHLRQPVGSKATPYNPCGTTITTSGWTIPLSGCWKLILAGKVRSLVDDMSRLFREGKAAISGELLGDFQSAGEQRGELVGVGWRS